MRLVALLLLISIVIIWTTAQAEDSDDQSYQVQSTGTITQDHSSQNAQALNLTVAPDIIEESEEQLKAKNQKNKPLLPDIFKDQGENDVSVDSGVLINDDGRNSEIIDGAKISIKVKTD